MSQFNDNQQRPWNLDLDAPTIEMVRAATCRKDGCKHDPYVAPCDGIDLADLHGKAIDRLANDPVLLVRVLTLLVSDQLQSTNITATSFGKSIAGPALERATDAMLESIADFFHGKRAAMVRAMAAKSKAVVELGAAKVIAKVDDPRLEKRILEAMDEGMEKALQKQLTRVASAIDSPESSE